LSVWETSVKELYEDPVFGDPRSGKTSMRAMSAAGFNGYEDLKLIDLPKP
jgi:hypothetical protein